MSTGNIVTCSKHNINNMIFNRLCISVTVLKRDRRSRCGTLESLITIVVDEMFQQQSVILHYNVGAKEDVKQMDGYQFQR